jgi:hypothetical protein
MFHVLEIDWKSSKFFGVDDADLGIINIRTVSNLGLRRIRVLILWDPANYNFGNQGVEAKRQMMLAKNLILSDLQVGSGHLEFGTIFNGKGSALYCEA